MEAGAYYDKGDAGGIEPLFCAIPERLHAPYCLKNDWFRRLY